MPGYYLTVLSLLAFSFDAIEGKSETARLLQTLLTGYHPGIKPVVNENTQMQVKVGFTLTRVEQLQESSQTLTTLGFLNVEWVDQMLKWNPKDYSGIDEFVLHRKYIWMPEIQILNSVHQMEDLGISSSEFRVHISHDGTVRWTPSFKLATFCPLKLEFFPFDTQKCGVSVINWTYKASSVNLTMLSDKVFEPTNLHESDNEWSLLETSVIRQIFHMDKNNNNSEQHDLPVITMTLTLERSPIFYLLNVLLPTVVIAQFSILVYLLPADCGEKIGFSITMLLAYFVVSLLVADIMPKGGSTIPYLTVYITLCMFLTAVSIVLSVVVLNMHHHHPYKRVPMCIRRLLFSCCARILCVDIHAYKTSSSKRKTSVMFDNLAMEIDDKLQNNNRHSSISKSTNELEEEEILELNRQEWMLLAKTLDRVFLIFSVVLITGITVIFFVVVKYASLSLGDIGSYITDVFVSES